MKTAAAKVVPETWRPIAAPVLGVGEAEPEELAPEPEPELELEEDESELELELESESEPLVLVLLEVEVAVAVTKPELVELGLLSVLDESTEKSNQHSICYGLEFSPNLPTLWPFSLQVLA